MKGKPPAMRCVVILVSALLLVLCAFLTGCTTGTEAPAPATTVPTPSPTTVPVIVTTTPVPVLTWEKIRPLPEERQVNLVLTKDRPTSEIHLLYQGGPGEIFTNRIIMRVYSSETAYQEYVMSDGKKPIPGDEIIAPGTRSGDRCEVFVISAGSRYKVMDEVVYGGMYY